MPGCKAMPAEPLPTVIVPVFNAYQALDACLASLDRTLPARSPVYVADDASTDPRVADVLDAWQQRSALAVTRVRHADTLGFPGNANAALARSEERRVGKEGVSTCRSRLSP